MLYFYEHFLEIYDNALRKRTGSYYTPPEVVNAMVRLVDEGLRGPLFGRARGLAADDVIVADPAMGTGTFLLGVLRSIADTVTNDVGPGGVPGALLEASHRLIGFELQFGPFAVAQLRLLAEYQEHLDTVTSLSTPPDLKLFITDTLANPFVEEEYLPQVMQPVAKSRQDANKIKKSQAITVVIGNPPYKDKAKGMGGWIETGSSGRPAPMDLWIPPSDWHVGAHAKHLKNLYVYFWRWATWKVFGSGFTETTGEKPVGQDGVVCFITAAGFLAGDGFQRIRDDLRRSCDEIWVIDCSPEGQQPEVPTRIFEGVQQPICIVLAMRSKNKNSSTPAVLKYYSLPRGKREEKFKALSALSLSSKNWITGPNGWRDPFSPNSSDEWNSFVELRDFFVSSSSGVLPGRTWVVAPDRKSLADRWSRLVSEKSATVKEDLFFPTLRDGKLADRHTQKVVLEGLAGHEFRPTTVAKTPEKLSSRYGSVSGHLTGNG